MPHTIIVIIQKMRLKINKTNRGQIDLGNDEIQDGPGPVLHQPLSLAFFRKNSQNGQNMNGIPVSRSRKTENAPTWRSPSPLFGGCFRALFWPTVSTFSIHSSYRSIHTHQLRLWQWMFLPPFLCHTTLTSLSNSHSTKQRPKQINNKSNVCYNWGCINEVWWCR